MSFFNVEVSGLDSLDEDLKEHEKAIKDQIPIALGIVGSEMVNDLQAIIEGYFYPSYIPTKYKRRHDYPSKGTSMMDASVMSYTPTTNELTFTYTPKTEHADYTEWEEDRPNEGTYPLPRKADALIVWGQHWHEMNEDDAIIPARPFWNYFLESQGNEKILDNFARGMLPKYAVVKEEGETVDLSEFALAADTNNVAPYDPR